MMGFLAGLFFVLSGWSLPHFIDDARQELFGNLTTPPGPVFIGITLKMDWSHFQAYFRDMIVALIGRLVVNPLAVWLLLPFFFPRALASWARFLHHAIVIARYHADCDFERVLQYRPGIWLRSWFRFPQYAAR